MKKKNYFIVIYLFKLLILQNELILIQTNQMNYVYKNVLINEEQFKPETKG